MNALRTTKIGTKTRGAALALLLCLISSPVAAQITTPLFIGTGQQILDEFGEIIIGNATMPTEERPLVQVLWAESGIYPPNSDGTPHPENAMLVGGASRIGALVSHHLERPGLFAIALSDPRPTSGAIFVRVYNAPTVEESLFYGDSEVIAIDGNTVLNVNIVAADKLIDPLRDTDGDGLPDHWEHLYFDRNPIGADPGTDYDGDGMTAAMEFLAGTNPHDVQSFLGVRNIRTIPSGPGTAHVVEWDSVDGRLYDLEYATNLLESVFVPVEGATNLASTPQGIVFTNVDVNARAAFYRLRLRLSEE